MDTKYRRVACLTLGAVAFSLALQPGCAAEFFVSTNGKVGNPGTKAQPAPSLEAARDAARNAGPGPHRIIVMPGDYFLEATFALDARDNGLAIDAESAGKATLYGGVPVTGWRRDGDKFWCAELPGVKEGSWDFRALIVNGRMPDRARMPEAGTFVHKSVFDVRWLSSVAGGWERPPTPEESKTMLYDPKDVPASLEVKNAEVRVYHMWDESLVGVATNDIARHALIFSTPSKSPPGAFGVKKYVIWNTREGMTRPGQWHLYRAAGKVVYWPLPGEDMTKAKVIAPKLERVIRIAGTEKAPAERITLRRLSIQCTTTPLKPGGFGAGAYGGAIDILRANECVIDGIEIQNVGGQGIQSANLTRCRIEGCRVFEIGACGIRSSGTDNVIARNHIHHVGAHHPSAVALNASHTMKGDDDRGGFHIYRNEIHDTPYSGIIVGGGGHLLEENIIYRVMREMHDGGAIYGGVKRTILRGNMVRDVVKIGEGYGVSSYYLDEGAEDCIVERNVSLGVERPTHNHIARRLTIRDNVFVAETNMTLSFQRSADCTFQGNTLFVPGKLKIGQPSAISLWTNNVIFREAVGTNGMIQAFTISQEMPPVTPPSRRGGATGVVRVEKPPVLDGEIGTDEWPAALMSLDREPSRWGASGAPAFAELAYDNECLYFAVNVTMFDVAKLRTGSAWGKDDGAEICIAGKTADGKPAIFIVRGFAGGTLQSAADAGAPAADAERLGKASRFVAKQYGKNRGGWRGEWAIPWKALGIEAAPGNKMAFNIGSFRAEDGVWRSWEGTLAQNWKLDQAAAMQLK